jgi:oxaloacetate decarboxylase alpha subunit
MTRLVDTTIRLLSQDPLAGHLSTARLLRLAEAQDGAGYAGLEVSGGGCFEAAINRAVESPWERIRAVKSRAPNTPLLMALRGTFLVGGRPAGQDLVRRFILCAAESGIDIFRLHDPLNDVEDLEGPAAAVREAGARLYAGLVFSEGPGEEALDGAARRLVSLGADRVVLHDPAGALDPATAGRLIEHLRTATRVPVGLYNQSPGGSAFAVAIEAARAGADPIATASYPVAMLTHRVPAELLAQALSGLGLDTGVERDHAWDIARDVEGDLAEVMASAPPVSPHVALRAALARVPVGLVVGLERRLRAVGATDRLDEVLDEVPRVREDCGLPPSAAPVGRMLASQSITHVLSARRWAAVDEDMRRLLLGEYGHPPGDVAPEARAVAEATPAEADPELTFEEARDEAGSLAASEEDLCLVALFGERAVPLLETVRGRGMLSGEDTTMDEGEAARVRRLIDVLSESEMAELTVEDGPTRITLRKPDATPTYVAPPPAPEPDEAAGQEPSATGNGPVDGEAVVRIESPMVGTFYRAASPTAPPFVEEGDTVEVGDVLCILEAMKLFNELTSDHAGTIRRVLAKNADAVEYGQPLFEIVPG